MRNSISKHTKLLVWDIDTNPPRGDWSIILWNDYSIANEPDYMSIPLLVEEQADSLRSRYLAWIYQLGETEIKGTRVIDILELRKGFSYWWVTSIMQKNNISDTSYINDVIKLFVLEDIISKLEVKVVTLASSNRNMAKVIKNLCFKKNIVFIYQDKKKGLKKSALKIIFYKFPKVIQVIIYLIRYLYNVFPNLINPTTYLKKLNTEICLFDGLVHLHSSAQLNGTYISNFWTILVDYLDNSKIQQLWLHTFSKHKDIPNLNTANKLINQFNNNSNQNHLIIDSFLSFKIIKKVLIDYCKLYKIKNNLYLFKNYFSPVDSELNLWEMYKYDFYNSIIGIEGLNCCIRLSQYETIFATISYQKTGVYLQENLSWEILLIYSWKAANNGNLIGVPHTSVRYWDLKYYYDPQSYNNYNKNPLPIPDIVAVNGPYAKKAYLDGGYPESKLKEVEALRFLDILCNNPDNSVIKKSELSKKILVCFDHLLLTNNKILYWLKIAQSYLGAKIKFVIKLHPAFPDAYDKNYMDNINIVDEPLIKLLNDCDILFSGSMTSSAVYAYCLGVPIIQMLDGKYFNASSLRGLSSVEYATTPEELIEKIYSMRLDKKSNNNSYFYLDYNIPMWRNLLGI